MTPGQNIIRVKILSDTGYIGCSFTKLTILLKSLATDHILMQPQVSLREISKCDQEKLGDASKCDQLPVVEISQELLICCQCKQNVKVQGRLFKASLA